MKNYYYLLCLMLLVSNAQLKAQSVTVDDLTPGIKPTYTFTYVTSRDIGTTTSYSNVFISSKPSGYSEYSPTVSDGDDLDPYVVFKVNGTVYPCSATFGTLGGCWSGGLQLSTNYATEGLTILAGSTIEIEVSGLITNPSNPESYTFSWRTADGGGNDSENFSASVESEVLSVADISDQNLGLAIYPNPSHKFLKLKGITRDLNYTVHNVLGENVLSGLYKVDSEINTSFLTEGVYVLKLENGKSVKFFKN